MKKSLLATFMIAGAFSMNVSAQCTSDVTCLGAATYGICPDSTTGIPHGTVGMPYSTVLSVKVPTDGTDFGFPSATVTNVDINSVTGLAPGLSYVCNPGTCSFPGGSNGCILISGTPTAVWNQQITVNLTAYGTIFGAPANIPQTNKQYYSIVDPAAAGIGSLDLAKFDVAQNSPNPFNFRSEILYSSPVPADVEFRVFNMLGTVVYSNVYKAEKGVNTITLQAGTFAPGIYMYALKNGNKTVTQRMIVSK